MMTSGQKIAVAAATVAAAAIAVGAVYELTKAPAPVVKSLPNPTVQLTETGPVAPVQLGAGGVVNFIAPSGGTFLGGSSTQSVTQAALAADIGHVTLQFWTNADGTMGSVKGTLSGTTLSFGAVTNQPGTGTGGSGGNTTSAVTAVIGGNGVVVQPGGQVQVAATDVNGNTIDQAAVVADDPLVLTSLGNGLFQAAPALGTTTLRDPTNALSGSVEVDII